MSIPSASVARSKSIANSIADAEYQIQKAVACGVRYAELYHIREECRDKVVPKLKELGYKVKVIDIGFGYSDVQVSW